MPAIDFPASPSVNDEYSFEGRTWLWNGTGWEVKSYPAALQLGSASAPSLYFTGDPNTGLYSPGADQVAITTGGTGRLFVDASGRIGIGATAASRTFELHSTVPVLRFVDTNAVGTPRGEFGAADGNITVAADQGSSGTGGNIIFYASGASERLRITSDGKVGIGTSSVSSGETFEVVGGIKGQSFNAIGTPAAFASAGGASVSYNGSGVAVVRAYSDAGGAAGTLVFNTGSEAARIDSSGRLLVGTSTSVVVGAVSAQGQIQIADTAIALQSITTYANSVDGPYLIFGKSRGASVASYTIVQNNDQLGTIRFAGSNGTSLGNLGASIAAFSDGAPGLNAMPGRLVFSTTADGAASPTERMRITSAGYVGIGTTTVRAKLDLGPDLSAQKLSVYADATYRIGFGVQGNEFRQYAHTGASTTWGYVSTSDQTTFTELMRLDSSGNLLIGKNSATANGGVLQVSNGITFPATQSACSDANTLDDYEEGTHTATLTPSGSGSITLNATYQTLTYTKVGRLVSIRGTLIASASSSPVGYVTVSLPFTPAAVSGIGYAGGSVFVDAATGVNTNEFVLMITTGGARIYLGDGTTLQSDSAQAIASAGQIYLEMNYHV